MNKSFKKIPWKVEHREDGMSFMAVPYDRKNKSVEYAWVIGGLEKEIIDWLSQAVEEKQKHE